MATLFRPNRKNTPHPEEDQFNFFMAVVAFAAVVLTCLIIFVLGRNFIEGGDPTYEVVPYGGSPTMVVATQAPIVAQPTTVGIEQPTLFFPSATPAVSERIDPDTVLRVAAITQLLGHSSAVSGVAFSPDGHFIASGDWDGLVKLWDARTFAEIYTFRSGSNRVDSVAFSPDSSRLAAAGQDSIVRLWDLTSGVEVMQLSEPTATINQIAFSPTGAVLAAASDDTYVYVWNMPDGMLMGVLAGHTSYVTSLAFAPDGTRIAAGGEDDTVRLWEIPTGNPLGVMLGNTSTVSSVAYSPNGSQITTTSADHSVRFWDASTLAQLRILSGHEENVNAVAYSPTGLLVATGAGGINDNTVRLWDTRTGAQLRALYPPGPVNAVAFSPSGLYLATGGSAFLTIWGVTDTVYPAAEVATPTPFPTADLSGQGGQAVDGDAETCLLTLRTDDVNVRSGPGVNYLQMSTLNSGQTVQATAWARGIDGDGFTWWRLTDGGWVRGDAFIDAANPDLPAACWQLQPLADIPPTPAQMQVLPTTVGSTQAPAATAGPCTLTIRATEANVRSVPQPDGTVIRVMQLNQTAQATGWTTGVAEGFTWWQLANGGWVRGDMVIDAANPSPPEACLSLPWITGE